MKRGGQIGLGAGLRAAGAWFVAVLLGSWAPAQELPAPGGPWVEVGLLEGLFSAAPALPVPPSQILLPEGELEETCRRISAKLASVGFGECRAAGLAWTGRSSVLDTPLLVREFPPRGKRWPLGRILLIGGIHGDEYSSVSVVFKWLATLDRYHTGLFHWRVAPLVNPDGLLRSRSTRMNEHGVDLNRNFPCPDWHAATADYWIRRTSKNPRRYPGPDPLSEPESRWLAEEIEDFRPDIVISVHAPHNVLDFDGPPEPPQRLGSLQLQLMGTYPGSLGRYAGVHNGLPVVTIELPSAGSMPSAEEQRAIWGDLVRWLQQRLEAPGSKIAR